MRTGVVAYETKPATEWILREPVQKVSPRYAHAALQATFATHLRAWARGRGRVGTEWRFWLAPDGEELRYLVPDVAYLSYDRLPKAAIAAAQEPVVAPDVAVEILSPDDRASHVDRKIDVYLHAAERERYSSSIRWREPFACAVNAVLPHSRSGSLTHAALPELELDLTSFFAELEN